MTWWKKVSGALSSKKSGGLALLDKNELEESLRSDDPDSLFIEPLLDEKSQLGAVSIDLRLGYDFQVSILTRKPSIELIAREGDARPISSFFQETRRDIGDRFVLYPHQVVIATTLEYLCLPSNVYADILSRSSYTRLGVHINTMIQPGYRGCVTLELCNHGNTPIELIVGCRLVQARFFRMETSSNYLKGNRKYFGDVRPTVSRAPDDEDLKIIKDITNN